jgi:hypothetical protein
MILSESYAATCFAQTSTEIKSTKKFDEFGDINCEHELARLDSFSIYLHDNPNLRGYIIVYGGRRGRRNEAKARAARMRYYLVHTRGHVAQRIIMIDGGYRETQTSELWLCPPNVPTPIPTPTVKAADVKLNGRVKVRGYDCGESLGG